MLNIIQNRKFYFIFSGLTVGLSILSLFIFGLKPSIDFSGGSLIELSFSGSRPVLEDMHAIFEDTIYGNVLVQPIGDNGYVFKMRFVNEQEHQAILSAVRSKFQVEGDPREAVSVEGSGEVIVTDVVAQTADNTTTTNETDFLQTSIQENKVLEERFETIGPAVSANLKDRSVKLTVVVIVAIILYIAYTFRKISRPVRSWKYGVTAAIALFHDVIITMGVFALLGRYYGVEVDIPFVVALITILGYSVNDTIVVFDRIREKLIQYGYENFEDIVNKGVNETLMRSINTSMTVLIVLVGLYFLGGESIRYFSLALIIGVGFGTYSSIFLASPLLVVWQKLADRR
ncbi:MAG: protein translocase subunit SecF [Candidatus Magasanikbacteria bacterium]|nr:protein translocase subunit SecF [Candidatus Magasanikbacteria bacterium]